MKHFIHGVKHGQEAVRFYLRGLRH
jgi:hypothetical protein